MNLPHLDAVNDVLCDPPNTSLEQVKMDLMSRMFEQKWLREYRLLNRYYLVATDATGIVSFGERHCEHCLSRTTKNGKTVYFHYVLEAKLVTRDGHAFFLASEWIENPAGEFKKQDCERTAFIRLSAKLKKQYFDKLNNHIRDYPSVSLPTGSILAKTLSKSTRITDGNLSSFCRTAR
jgi:hypothetical protein